MIIHNDGLPDPVYQWIVKTQGEYSKGDADISVTELINPPRIRILKNKYYSQLEVNASSLLNVTVGNCIHDGIEQATKTGVAERRLFIEVNGWRLSGAMDHYHDGLLSDYKTANKWKTLLCNDGRIEEWEEQLNVYAHILRENGHAVSGLQIWAYFKDWNRGEFGQNSKKGQIFRPNLSCGYPEKEQLTIPLELWTPERAEAFVKERVKLHQEAEKLLPECPKEELWGGKRCSDYCEVGKNGLCDQYNRSKENK